MSESAQGRFEQFRNFWRLHRRRILLGAGFLALTAGSLFIFRPSPPPSALLGYLPSNDTPVFGVDVALLRKSGMLDQLAGKPGHEEPEYQQFVAATGFDYRRDLDAVLAGLGESSAYFVLRGRFDFEKLSAYARSHGGKCTEEFCTLPGSQPGRHVSYRMLGRNLLALAAGSDVIGAVAIRKAASVPSVDPPSAPLWLNLPASSFHPRAELPPAYTAFIEALDGAQRALLTVDAAPNGLQITLSAPCADDVHARQIANRLTSATSTLKDLVARSGEKLDAASPAGVLAAGSFRAENNVARGTWPLSQSFLDALAK